MLDLQSVIVNDDTLDDQPQDGLSLGDAGSFQPGADALTECGEVRKRLLRFEPPFLNMALVLIMLLRQVTLLGKRPTLARQLLQADHLGLVGLEQPTVGAVQSLDAGTQLSTGSISAHSDGLAGKALELRQYLGRLLEQVDDMVPNGGLEFLGLDTAAGTSGWTRRQDAVFAVTQV